MALSLAMVNYKMYPIFFKTCKIEKEIESLWPILYCA